MQLQNPSRPKSLHWLWLHAPQGAPSSAHGISGCGGAVEHKGSVGVGVAVGGTPEGHPSRALFTAWRISEISICPSVLASPSEHADTAVFPSATFTIASSSSTVTSAL